MSESLVVPGEAICREEEYMAYRNVYVDLKGVIRAAVVGEAVFDNVNRRVQIKPVKEVKMPKSGDIVLGYVAAMKDDLAQVEIIGYDVTKTFKHTFTGVLHILQVTEPKGEKDSLYNYIRLGDFVKVKVLNSYVPFILTMKEPRLGVVLAFCTKCGNALHLSGDQLVCPVCRNTDSRKISFDYMLVSRGKKVAKT